MEEKSHSSLLTHLSCILMYVPEAGVQCCIIRTKTKCPGDGDLFLQKKSVFPVSLFSKNVHPENFFTPLSHVLVIYFLLSFFTCALNFSMVLLQSILLTKLSDKMNKPREDEYYLYIVRFLYGNNRTSGRSLFK